MALVKCEECKAEIARSAKTCPQCGAKNGPKEYSIGTLIVLLVVIGVTYNILSEGTSPERGQAKSTSSSSTKATATPAPTPTWRTSSSIDEMTEKSSHYASSPSVRPDSKMQFPYHDVRSWIGVGCSGGRTWAYFGFDEAPNLTNDETKSGYNLINARIKWDQNITSVELHQEWGDRFLTFANSASAIANLAGANNVKLELSWYGQERPVFTYSLKGSSKAIAEIKSKCRS